MKEKTESALKRVMTAYDDKLGKQKGERDQEVSAQEHFLAEFEKTAAQLIRPTFEQFGEALKAHGHEYRIIETPRTVNDRGRRGMASIELEIRPKDADFTNYNPVSGVPSLSVICDEVRGELRFHECTMGPGRGGHSGTRASYKLAQITTDLIEYHLLALVEQVLD